MDDSAPAIVTSQSVNPTAANVRPTPFKVPAIGTELVCLGPETTYDNICVKGGK